MLIKSGERFNQFLITETEELFKNILGNEDTVLPGKGVPDVNEDEGKVDLTFYVDPQQRTYVKLHSMAIKGLMMLSYVVK